MVKLSYILNSLWVLWKEPTGNAVIPSVEYFLKELLMGGSGSWWAYCEVNCERTQGFLSQSTHWILCRVNCERTQEFLSQSAHWALCWVNCESDQGFLSQSAWWVLFGVNCERTQGFLSQSTHWALCWALFKSIHPVPSEYWVGKLFQNPQWTHHVPTG